MVETRRIEDIETLQRQAAALKAKADAATRAYNRATWVRFVLVFFPVPFVVVLFRLSLEVWHYYVAGALFIIFAAVLFAVDGAAAAKRNASVHAAESAQKAYEEALAGNTYRRRRPPD
jgi:hypothetical protein